MIVDLEGGKEVVRSVSSARSELSPTYPLYSPEKENWDTGVFGLVNNLEVLIILITLL